MSTFLLWLVYRFYIIAIAVLTAIGAFYFRKKNTIADAELKQEGLSQPEKQEISPIPAVTGQEPEPQIQEPVAEEKYKSNKVSVEECKRLAAKFRICNA